MGPPTTLLHVIRHGQTRHNAARRIQGTLLDDGLSPEGRAQARALTARLKSVPFDAICTSPLKRALETAEPLAQATGALLLVEPDLREYSWGIYQGKVQTPDLERETRTYVARWCAGELDLCPPGGEPPRLAAARARIAVERLCEAHAGGTLAVVAHGRINKILLAALIHDAPQRMEDFPQSNTGVTLLEGAPGSWGVRFRNDTSHLSARTDLSPGE